MRKLFTFLMTFFILIKMSKKFWNIMYLIFPKFTFLFSEKTLVFILFCIIIIMISSSWGNIDEKWLVLSLMFIICLIVTSLINLRFNYSFINNFSILFDSYLLFFFLLVLLGLKTDFFDMKICLKTILLFSFFQGILGILQYITKNTIIPIYDIDGNPIVSSIYYLNGVSSNKSFFVQQYGAKIRSFGMTDSALTLGLLMLFALAVIISHKDIFGKRLRTILVSVYIVTIVFTLTRVIYMACILLLAILIFRNNSKFLKSFFYVFLCVQSLVLILSNYIDAISKYLTSSYTGSLVSRLEGYHYFIGYYGFSIGNFLMGMDNVSYGNFLHSFYTLDNESLNIYMDIGFIGCLFVFFTMLSVLKLKRGNNIPVDLVIMALFPFVGIINSVYYFFSGVAIFMVIFYKNEREKKL